MQLPSGIADAIATTPDSWNTLDILPVCLFIQLDFEIVLSIVLSTSKSRLAC